jgi:hypothetical protein
MDFKSHVGIPVVNTSDESTRALVGTIIGTAQEVDHIDSTWTNDPSMSSVHNDIQSSDADSCESSVVLPVSDSAWVTDQNEIWFPLQTRTVLQTSVHNKTSADPAGVTGPMVPEFPLQGPEPLSSTPDLSSVPDHLKQLYNRSLENLKGEEESMALQHLLCAYSDVFAQHDFDLGEFSAIMHRIDTGDAPPVKHGLRRTPLGFQGEEEAHLHKMVDHGIIQPSASEWAAAPVIVKKKDGKYRYCVDYRGLNKLTRKDSFPLPLIEECLDALADNVYFSTLDMASGYWQILIHPEDRHKTAFITKYGLFEHVRLAMGLCNSPATYQRIMTYVLQNMLWQNVLVYLDDIIILGRNFKEHLATLEEVLKRFRKHNLKFKPKKCELFRTEVDFLGRRVGRDGISIPEAKVRSVLEWQVPVKRNQLEAFLGFVNYHRLFISNMADVCDILYRLVQETAPGAPLAWKQEHQDAFNILREAMTSAPVLAYPNSTGVFILDVDASDVAIGAELLQIQDEQEKVIAYGSQSLNAAQRRYCTTRKELLALVVFLNHFRFYLLGRYFLVRTDHNSLTWLMRFKHLQGQLARWLEAISQFDFRIVHRAGKMHGNADGLSRSSSEECPHYRSDISVDQLPCGGCDHCVQMHEKWDRFENFVDDVLPLTMRRNSLPSDVEVDINLETKDIDWSTEQRNDPDLAIVIRWLTDQEDPSEGVLFAQSATVKHLWRMRKQLKMQDELLLYLWHDVTTTRPLLVVPQKLRHHLIDKGHSNICSGHPGPEKTYHLPERAFTGDRPWASWIPVGRPAQCRCVAGRCNGL